MAIQYPVDTAATAGRWMLYDTTTEAEPVRMSGTGNWPVGDGGPIQGLAENLVPLLKVTDDQPLVDDAMARLVGTPAIDVSANEIRTTWAIVSRSLREKQDVVSNLEYEEANKHFDIQREALETRIVVAALLRTVKNLNVPAGLQTFADNYLAKATKIYKNRQKIQAVLAQIEADEIVDLDALVFEPTDD